MARLARFYNLIVFVFVIVSAEETALNYRQSRDSDPKIFGVASVARVTSRNGRISSSGGIHIYPGPSGVVYDPATFAKATEGKYATGSVQIHPGAVVSSAQAGFDPGFWMDWPRQWPQWPGQSQYGFGDPWDTRVEFPQTRMRQWVYPRHLSFNPFLNFWR